MMDFKSKGRLWANNISKKFNTIRQEVDNIVNQDAVKFVETQVQTVGQSMKKVCSEVVQLVGPAKCEAQAVAPKGNASVGTYKKPIIGTEENDGHKFPSKQLYSKPSDVSDMNTFGSPNLVYQTTAPTPHESEQEPEVDLAGNIDDVLTDEKYYPSVEETAMENSNIPDALDSIASFENDSSSANIQQMLSHELMDNENTCVSSDEEIPSVREVESVHCNIEDIRVSIANTSNVNSCVSLDKHSSSNLVMSKDSQPSQEVENAYFNPEDVSDSISMTSSALRLSEMSSVGSSCVSLNEVLANTESCANAINAAADASNSSSLLVSSTPAPVLSGNKAEEETGLMFSNCVLSMESTDRLASSLSLVYPAINCCNVEKADTGVSLSNSDMPLQSTACSTCSTNVVDDLVDSGMETIDLFVQLKPEESCVVVDNSMLYEVVRQFHRQRSYKKKIADMFNTRKRLSKEYEQLAIWCGDLDTESNQDTVNSDQLQLSQDSEWELL